MQNKCKRYVKTVLLLVMAVCLIQVGVSMWQSAVHKRQRQQLKQLMEVTQTGADKESSSGFSSDKEIATQGGTGNPQMTVCPPVMEKYATLYECNNDMTGWLSIEGTAIDYPVMQCSDNEYYLSHNFYKENDKYGCLYVKDIADVNTPSTNVIIYGHDMRDGSMFGGLDLYEQESYYREHPCISFNTLYEERTYEIVAAFLSQVYYQNQDVFKYYNLYNAATQKD